MLTMNRSRLAMKTPTHTINETAHLRCMTTARLGCVMKRTLAQGLRDATQWRYPHCKRLDEMLGNEYKTQICSIAGALEVVGERWSLLILRDVFLGLRRFDQIQANLGIARNVLQARLERLTEQGVLKRHLYQERPSRYEYRLTA